MVTNEVLERRINSIAVDSGKAPEEVLAEAFRLYFLARKCSQKGYSLNLAIPDNNCDPELAFKIKSIARDLSSINFKESL